jgi:hypothetical protein
MHLIFFVRGIYSQVEIFKTMIQGVYWKWRRINLDTNKEEEILVQGALRPSVFGTYEYIFPEECLAEVLCIMGINKTNYGSYQNGGSIKEKVQMATLRKIFGAGKIDDKIFEEALKIPPTLIINNIWRGLSHCIIPGVAIHCIGIKPDERKDFDFTGVGLGRYNQEAL